ncbi:DddA-like double-stranded DNA deaminase toxin [Amycolatopsis sp. NPDC059657]|uniref:DddA-like double-stranded DNA deaminase toxin n=1 Tax=Amycolatopsis sp. NPDC059657 TaxID=3346899 RepID=UPI003671B57C
MSVEKTVASVNEAVAKTQVAIERLRQAAQYVDEARQTLVQATQGSTDHEVGHAVGALMAAAGGAAEVGQLVAEVPAGLSAYAKSLTGGHDAPGGGRSPGQAAPSSAAQTKPEDPVEKARQELPPPVAGRRGVKTVGTWFAPGEAGTAITSGRDDRTERVDEILKEAGCDRRPITAAADVELKLAAEMRDNGITDATVVINNIPCTGKTSCDGLLSIVLPEGSTMTVHGPDGFKKVYKGGATWQW